MIRAALLALALSGSAAHASSRLTPLNPAKAEVAFRAYAFGVVPVDGVFSRFAGMLVTDPEAPGTCHVEVSVEVTSLTTADADIQADVLSPSLLDAAAFPRLGFIGDCTQGAIVGTLTMHGVSRRIALQVTRARNRYVAQADLRRSEWGITGRRLIAGSTVRIRITAVVPD